MRIFRAYDFVNDMRSPKPTISPKLNILTTTRRTHFLEKKLCFSAAHRGKLAI
ncbi:hypothetical protein [Cylindrospermum sp. FACHB-282]|uniref:hypothetical protein n=1 Tax=Cylindrospermum sp. FACHB-282 TaxID=2692794 RepID=UPI001687BB6E|nr:hypothetical protein [Cylindrospermum sp. FACHB-282]MBD2385002.1 hypothetical protein [Cylindrospermum sp. FACHB-282]